MKTRSQVVTTLSPMRENRQVSAALRALSNHGYGICARSGYGSY